MMSRVASSSIILSLALAGACAGPQRQPQTMTPFDPPTSDVPKDGGSPASLRRARERGIVIGGLPVGPHNAITDVPGVRVGHTTVVSGDDVRTGVTVILGPSGNPFRDKLPAALAVANGYGKLVGATQLVELGELESPIALTNTLSVHRVADAVLGWLLALPGNEDVRSINVVVGETNDGRLNDIRGRHVTEAHVLQALASARSGSVDLGAVGAGTGTMCLGYKGGIGSSSRRVGEHTVGVLVQTNFGGNLRLPGSAGGGEELSSHAASAPPTEHGSCMIVIATDAPLDARNLQRLARRTFAGMARTGASFSNGSGDYALAFTTSRAALEGGAVVANGEMTPFFVAAADATEEAILDSLFMAQGDFGARALR
jgi:D-aminopeptidase